MAKALYGHMAAHDPRLLNEVVRLRARVAELEAEVAVLKSRTEDVDLAAELADGVYLNHVEPALV